VWQFSIQGSKTGRNCHSATSVPKEKYLDFEEIKVFVGFKSPVVNTNHRMLGYKRIHAHFFMDTFFTTSKAIRSSRGYTCMQLFVTDKGFVFLVPMKSKKQVPAALKIFAKAIGAPGAIVAGC
jgi:hypothetical protein